jgi:hypothetical protein
MATREGRERRRVGDVFSGRNSGSIDSDWLWVMAAYGQRLVMRAAGPQQKRHARY